MFSGAYFNNNTRSFNKALQIMFMYWQKVFSEHCIDLLDLYNYTT